MFMKKLTEIDQLKQIIAEQEEKIHQLETIISLMPGHVYWKSKEGVYLGSNNNQAKTLGLQKGTDLVGKTDFDFAWKYQAKAFREVDQRVIYTGVEFTVEEPAVIGNKEVVFLSKKLPLRNKDGNIMGILGISFDITAMKLQEAKLLAEKEQAEVTLEHIIAHMPGHVYWLNRNNVYLGCNEQQAKNAGLANRHEIIGKKNKDMIWSEQADDVDSLNEKVMSSGHSMEFEETAQNIDGIKTFLSKKVPIYDKNTNVIGLLGISFDITDRKQQEEQKAAFLTVVSHEFRGPLTNIQGLAQFLKLAKNIHEKEIELAVSDIISEVKRATSLLSDMVDLFDPNFTKDNTLYVDDVNLAEVIDSITPEINFKPEIKFSVAISPNVPTRININVVKLRNIIKILLQNSAEQTKQGFIKVIVNTINTQNRPSLYIELIDTSASIYPENKDYVFNALGVGNHLEKDYLYHKPHIKLTMAKRLIESMDGTISLLAHPGKGSEFEIVIPYQPVSASKTIAHSIDMSQEPNQLSCTKIPTGLKVLVVEDDKITNQLLTNTFKQFKCKVKQVYTGQEAIKSIQKQHYDLISLDITLPDINGAQVLKKLPQENLPAVIAVTSHATKADVDYLYNQGFMAVLTKPVNADDIENFLEAYARILQENQ